MIVYICLPPEEHAVDLLELLVGGVFEVVAELQLAVELGQQIVAQSARLVQPLPVLLDVRVHVFDELVDELVQLEAEVPGQPLARV